MKFRTLVSLLFLSAGCAATQTPAAGEPAVVLSPAEVGAPASINAPFREPELKVDSWTQRFEGESREVYRARQEIVDALEIEPGQTVADVGTGTGLFVAYLSAAVGPTGRVIATDIAPSFIEHVQRRADAAGLKNVSVLLGERADVKLEPSSVDLIYTCDTYHHFEDTAAILATMRSALRPNGRLVVVDYHRIEGVTRPFLMTHVRAAREVFEAEIVGAGFTQMTAPEAPFLKENYLMVFRR